MSLEKHYFVDQSLLAERNFYSLGMFD